MNITSKYGLITELERHISSSMGLIKGLWSYFEFHYIASDWRCLTLVYFTLVYLFSYGLIAYNPN